MFMEMNSFLPHFNQPYKTFLCQIKHLLILILFQYLYLVPYLKIACLSVYNAHALKPHLHARFIITQMYPFFSLCVSECALSITFCIFLMF